MRAIIHGSSGADLDVITAEASDVLAPKVIVDRDGEPMTGTLALFGNALAGDVRQGRTFYTTNPKAIQSGTMAERGAAAYTPSTYNQVIQGNQYLTGAQTILGDGNLASQYIKKGVTIFGVTGSFEGYVPTATDLYLRGNNIAGWKPSNGGFFLEAGGIRADIDHTYRPRLYTNRAINLVPYSKINVQLMVTKNYGTKFSIRFYINAVADSVSGLYRGDLVGEAVIDFPGVNKEFVISAPTVPSSSVIMVDFSSTQTNNSWTGWIYRIWLS